MKKFILGTLAAAAMLFTSCSQDELLVGNGDLATVNVSVDNATVISSRAFGKGEEATTLKFAVYDLTGETPTLLGELFEEGDVKTGVKTDTNFPGSKAYSLQLATGRTYGFVFWAANPGAPYTVDFGLNGAVMTANYENAVANDETLDAFFAYETITVNGPQTLQVGLKRPFTQINFGTSDMAASAAAGYTPAQTKVVVSGVYTKLNLMTKQVEGETTDVEFRYAEIPSSEEKFPNVKEGTKYQYLAMTYVLVPEDQILVTTDLYHKNGAPEYTLNVANVPVQRNYRTNIFGALLTDELSVEVETKPEFDGDNNEEVVNVPEGKAVMNNTTYESIKEAIAAINGNEATIYVGKSDWTASEQLVLPAELDNVTITIKGTAGDDSKLTFDKEIYFSTKKVSLAFEGLNIVRQNGNGALAEGDYFPLIHLQNETYKDCTIQGCVRLIVDGTATFDGCYFVNETSSSTPANSISYYGASKSQVIVNNCEFHNVNRAIQLYNDASVPGSCEMNLTVKDTKFYASDKKDLSAIEIQTQAGGMCGTVRIDNCTAEGFYEENEGKGLWAEVRNIDPAPFPRTYYFNIFVDGVQVHGSNAITVNGEDVATLADAVKNVQDGGTIALGYGDYDGKNVDWKGKNITIEGKGKNATNIANIDFVDANGSSMTLSNLSFGPVNNSTNHTASGFRGTVKMIFENCAINAEYHCFNGDFDFNDCEFNYNPGSDPAKGGRYALWGETSGTINCTRCTFNDTLMDKGILVYSDNNYELGDINLTDCTFNAAAQTKGNACVEIHAEKLTKGGTVTIENITNNGYASIWREKNNEDNKNGNKKYYTIIVDGETEQKPE